MTRRWRLRLGWNCWENCEDATLFGSDAAAAAGEFVRTAEEFGVEKYREEASFADYAPQLLRRHRPPAPLPAALAEVVRGKDANDIIDAQDDVLH